MSKPRIKLVDDNKYVKYLDEIPQTTLESPISKNSYPTVDHKNEFYNSPDLIKLEKFDGRDAWSEFLTPVVSTSQSSWNTSTTRTLSSRFSILSVGQILPKINYTVLMYCPIRDIMVEDEKLDIFKKSLYYAVNYLFVFGASHVGCFNYQGLLDKGYAPFEDFKDISDMINRYSSCRNIIGPDHSQCLDNTDARIFRSIFNVNLESNVESIKYELLKFGPVVSVMKVFEDFKYYNGLNLYEGPGDNDKEIGARCVIIMGFGKTEDGKDYWIVDPSLGVAWGREGYFYCLMNIDRCDIEQNCVGIYPDLPVFSEYILNYYQNKQIDKKLVDLRSQVKIDPNSFLVEGRSKFMMKKYPDIKIDYIENKLLPEYSKFEAKNVDSYVYKELKETGISYWKFFLITFLIFSFGLFLILKK
jgi:hypothetical protein